MFEDLYNVLLEAGLGNDDIVFAFIFFVFVPCFIFFEYYIRGKRTNKNDYLDKMNYEKNMLIVDINKIVGSKNKRKIEFMSKVAKERIDKMGEYAIKKLELEKNKKEKK